MAEHAGTPVGWHTRWVSDNKLSPWADGVAAQETACRTLQALFCFDQLNAGSLAFAENLAFSDNTPTVGCLNKLRSARPGMDSICQRICDLLCQFGIELVSVHRPGVDNVLADGLSRGTVAPCTSELSLSRLGLRSMLAHTNTRQSQRHYQELVPVTHSNRICLHLQLVELC